MAEEFSAKNGCVPPLCRVARRHVINYNLSTTAAIEKFAVRPINHANPLFLRSRIVYVRTILPGDFNWIVDRVIIHLTGLCANGATTPIPLGTMQIHKEYLLNH